MQTDDNKSKATLQLQIMTDKPPPYENQWQAGYGMQSEPPATLAPQQHRNPQPMYQQHQQFTGTHPQCDELKLRWQFYVHARA